MKPDLKTMLKATLVCVLLTLAWLFFTQPQTARLDYLEEFELIAVWTADLIGWVAYLTGKLQKSKKP